MIILAHRGLWRDKPERNTRNAFQLAFEGGYGVETDVRDQDGVVPERDGYVQLHAHVEVISFR